MYDMFFSEDVGARLLALAGANTRAITLARRYGMDAEAARLCQEVYAGALNDLAVAFGLAPALAPAVITPRRETVEHVRTANGTTGLY